MITTDACRTIGYAGDQYRGCFTFTASCRRHHHRHHRPLQDDLKSCMTVKTLSSTLFMFFATFASTVALGVVIKRVTVCPDEDYADCEVGCNDRFSFAFDTIITNTNPPPPTDNQKPNQAQTKSRPNQTNLNQTEPNDDSHASQSGTSYLGVTEFLLMNSIAGMVHALAGCQPLLVLRPTGPITAFISLLFNFSTTMEIEVRLLGGCASRSWESSVQLRGAQSAAWRCSRQTLRPDAD